MDFAFVPGLGDPAIDALSAVYWRRPGTTVVSVFLDDLNVHGFLQSVKTFGVPAGDLIVGAHGSAEGELLVRLDSTTSPMTIYEDLEKVNASGNIKIPPEVMGANTNFRLAGCLIGTKDCEPFLELLKIALGNPKNLSAPAFIHGIMPMAGGKEFYEFMRYAFWVLGNEDGKEPLPTRDAVVGKFFDAGYKDVGGTEIPFEDWDKWVPAAAMLNLKSTNGQQLDLEFPVSLAIDNKLSIVLDFKRTWICGLQRVTLPVVNSVAYPLDDKAKRGILELELPKHRTFQDSHPYPVYKRHHFKTLAAFIKGWNWAVTRAGTTQLQYIGTRFLYELQIPIIKPGTSDELIYNYYRDSGTPTINFTENNQPYKLFGVI